MPILFIFFFFRELLFQAADLFHQFWQVRESGFDSPPLGVGSRRIAEVGTWGLDGTDDACLASEDGVVTDGDVPIHTSLSSHDDMVTDFGAACDADLRTEEVVLADFDIVSQMAKDIDLGTAADDGIIHRTVVDGGAGADFDVVADDGAAELADVMVMSLFVCREAEALPAYDGMRAKDDTVTQDAVLVYDSPRIQLAVFAELRLLSDVAVRIDDAAVSDFRAVFDDGIRHDGDVFPDQGFGADDGSLMDAWFPFVFRAEDFDEFTEGAAGIGNDDKILRVVGGEFIDKDDTGLHFFDVLGINAASEGHMRGACAFSTGNVIDQDRAVPIEGAADQGSDFTCCFFHDGPHLDADEAALDAAFAVPSILAITSSVMSTAPLGTALLCMTMPMPFSFAIWAA